MGGMAPNGSVFPNQERASHATMIYHNLTKGVIWAPDGLKDALISVPQVPLINVSSTFFLPFYSDTNDSNDGD
jgi:hypothetical protein